MLLFSPRFDKYGFIGTDNDGTFIYCGRRSGGSAS